MLEQARWTHAGKETIYVDKMAIIMRSEKKGKINPDLRAHTKNIFLAILSSDTLKGGSIRTVGFPTICWVEFTKLSG